MSNFGLFGHGEGAHPAYKANLGKARIKGGFPADETNCCVYCGRHTRNASLFVYLSSLGEPMAPRDDGFDDLGYYPIGPDCARLARAAGVAVHERPTGEALTGRGR